MLLTPGEILTIINPVEVPDRENQRITVLDNTIYLQFGGESGGRGPAGRDGNVPIFGVEPIGETRYVRVVAYQRPDGTLIPNDVLDNYVGENGLTTIDGATDIRGARGERGLQGLRGEQGPQGEAGADGQDGADGEDGLDGPVPILAGEPDGERRLIRVTALRYSDGTLVPFSDAASYLGAGGLVVKALATDFRGAQGLQGLQGIQGQTGATGGVPQFAIETDGERRVVRLVSYRNADGTTTAVNGTNNYLGPLGLTNLAAATDIRGPQGPQGTPGVGGGGGGGLFVERRLAADYQIAQTKGYTVIAVEDTIDQKPIRHGSPDVWEWVLAPGERIWLEASIVMDPSGNSATVGGIGVQIFQSVGANGPAVYSFNGDTSTNAAENSATGQAHHTDVGSVPAANYGRARSMSTTGNASAQSKSHAEIEVHNTATTGTTAVRILGVAFGASATSTTKVRAQSSVRGQIFPAGSVFY